MYESVLIATDGSEWTREAVAHGLGLAERYGASVHVLSVVNTRALTFDEEGFIDDQQILDMLEESGQRATAAVVDQAHDRGLEATADVVSGSPAAEIRRYATANDVDLIAMGTRGRSGLARFMLGSVAESVLRKADQPVLTAKSKTAPQDPAYDTVLFPTDGSAHAERVADHAFDIADRYDATVHALSVIDTSLVQSPDLLAALERESEAALQTMEERGEEADVDVVARVWRGAPHECITTYAEDRGSDLIVMGTHGRRGLDRFLTQSVAERVVRTAPVPVCTLREPDES